MKQEEKNWTQIREELLKNKYWKFKFKPITKHVISVTYMEVIELCENNKFGGSIKHNGLFVFKHESNGGEQMLFLRNWERMVCSFYHDDNEITPITEKEYNDAIKKYVNITEEKFIIKNA